MKQFIIGLTVAIQAGTAVGIEPEEPAAAVTPIKVVHEAHRTAPVLAWPIYRAEQVSIAALWRRRHSGRN